MKTVLKMIRIISYPETDYPFNIPFFYSLFLHVTQKNQRLHYLPQQITRKRQLRCGNSRINSGLSSRTGWHQNTLRSQDAR